MRVLNGPLYGFLGGCKTALLLRFICIALFWPAASWADQTITDVGSVNIQKAKVSAFIVVDQFGYLPESEKIAVVRNPTKGFDATQKFEPGNDYQLVDLATQKAVYRAKPISWRNGSTAKTSGDQVWRFDFSAIQTPGAYVVYDSKNNLKSPTVNIGPDVYKNVLKHAVRTFFYQRAGFAKKQPYAEAPWVDEASHLRPGQDKNARLFNGDASTERDLSGGWYDAGDYNKYTNWHARYLVTLLHTYLETPSVWTDDFNIPESGNGVPDLIDEIIWGFDWLLKMQQSDGGVLSVMGLDHASPPSASKGPSVYGPASTSASLSAAAAYAFGAKVLLDLNAKKFGPYAAQLKTSAERAWQWAHANPSAIFKNQAHSVAAGEQEVDDNTRIYKRVAAAIYLYAATQDVKYKKIVQSSLHPLTAISPWTEEQLSNLLFYISLPGVDQNFKNKVIQSYSQAMLSNVNLQAIKTDKEAYLAYLNSHHFGWGSNRTMAKKGLTFYYLLQYNLPVFDAQELNNIAQRYLHYIHGVNPMAMVYLSNMYAEGVHSSVNEFYHAWFVDGSKLWDRVGQSKYGPAPGFLVGGPNIHYRWDDICEVKNHNQRHKCGKEELSPPKDQPPMKSYLDFNTSWPINSWQITENHNDYQVAYIRLLAKFVN